MLVLLLVVVIGCSDKDDGNNGFSVVVVVFVVVKVAVTFRRRSLSFRRCFSTKLGVFLAAAEFRRLIEEVMEEGGDDEGDFCC